MAPAPDYFCFGEHFEDDVDHKKMVQCFIGEAALRLINTKLFVAVFHGSNKVFPVTLTAFRPCKVIGIEHDA